MEKVKKRETAGVKNVMKGEKNRERSKENFKNDS